MTVVNNCTYRRPDGKFACTECGADSALCKCLYPDDATHKRLTSREGQVITELWKELQIEINTNSIQDWMAESILRTSAVLTKIREYGLQRGVTADEIHHACVAAAAALLQLSLYGDPSYVYESDSVHDKAED